jgi:hypothetical protein
MILNTARIRTWANDWVSDPLATILIHTNVSLFYIWVTHDFLTHFSQAEGVPGVDDVNPPTKRPEFCWFPVADYEKEKNRLLGLSGPAQPTSSSGTVVHHNYYGHPFNPAGFPPNQPFPTPPMFQPPNSNGPTPPNASQAPDRLSPPPEIPHFENFLIFAGITPDMKKTRDILSEEGIDCFGRLLDRRTYSFESFRSMGIPFAMADDLYKAVPKYNHHLKKYNHHLKSL